MHIKTHRFPLVILFILGLLISGLGTNAQAPTQDTKLQTGTTPGAQAIEFILPDADGRVHKLSDFKGRFVVLEWVNFQCPFSAKHYSTGNIPKLQKDYTAKDVIWLSINSSAPGKPGNFSGTKVKEMLKERNAVPTHYLLDADGKVGKAYGAKTTPQMFVLNPQGKIIYAGAIDDKPTPSPEDVASAQNYVKAALDHALAGHPVKIAQTKAYGCSVKYAD